MKSSIPTTDILGVQVSALNMDLAVKLIESWIANQDREYVEVCTVHTIMECQRDPKLLRACNGAGMRTPDGMPLVWLSKLAGHDEVSRVYGPDLMEALSRRSAETGHSHFFYGGVTGVADTLAANLTKRFPGLNVAGTHTPPMQRVGQIESAEIIESINRSQADIVWCGLGTPKQDWWIYNHRHLLNAPVLIAIGAAFDFHTGRVRQAPDWIQRSGLEWAFRLSQDPKRLWRRYLVDNTKFVLKIARRGLTNQR